MRARWDAFAAENARYYVNTGRRDWGADRFYAAGKGTAEAAVRWAGKGHGSGRALDLGCGPGRLAVHLAREFERVDGVDVSERMIESARQAGLPANVHFEVLHDTRLPFPDDAFDFAVSWLVFQHIPERDVVGAYLAETARVLKPGGRAVFQFDTRRTGALRRLALSLPDPLLPRPNRRFIRRYPVPESWIRHALRESGLSVVEERAAGTPEHQFLLGPT